MLSIKLKDFKANLGAVVRPNRFMCEMTPPNILWTEDALMADYDSASVLEKVQWHLKSTSIPARTIGEYEMKYYGMTYRLTGDTTYNDLTMTFLNEETWEVRTFFEKWQEACHIVQKDKPANIMITPSQNWNAIDLLASSEIIVTQLGLQGEKLAVYKFACPFPKEVGEIELSMESTDAAEEFTVTFGYSYWERIL